MLDGGLRERADADDGGDEHGGWGSVELLVGLAEQG
jgi:hypothetical protein